MVDHYAVLGVPRSASPEAIRRAYHRAARRLHPDMNPNGNSAEAFLRLQAAYELLSDPQKRQEYDALLTREGRDRLQLSLCYSQNYLRPLSETQVLYVLLQASVPPGQAAPASPPLNTCLVLDRSTSMQGRRLDILKRTAIEIVRQVRKEDNLSIVAFSDRAEILLSPGTRMDQTEMERQIRMLQPGGATEILRGLEAGLAAVSRNLGKTSVNHIILITDGHTYGDEQACLELADRAAENGIGISSLGIGHEWNDVFLEKLAGVTGGSTAYLPEIDDLGNFLRQKLSSLGCLYCERANLEAALAPGVELRYAFRLSPEASPLEPGFPVQVGGVSWGTPLSVILEFHIPPFSQQALSGSWSGDGTFTLLDGALSYLPIGQEGPDLNIPLRIERPVNPAAGVEEPPPILMQALSRLTLYRMQERARQELNAGEIEKATRRLQRLATHLFSRGERELARTVLEEAAHVEKSRALSSEGQKRLKYGTRALLPAAGTLTDDKNLTAAGQHGRSGSGPGWAP